MLVSPPLQSPPSWPPSPLSQCVCIVGVVVVVVVVVVVDVRVSVVVVGVGVVCCCRLCRGCWCGGCSVVVAVVLGRLSVVDVGGCGVGGCCVGCCGRSRCGYC